MSCLLFLVWMLTTVDGGQATPCRLCEHGPESTPDPTKVIPTATDGSTCGFFQNSAPFAETGTTACLGIQAVATPCGCNRPPNACHLCWDQSNITQPTRQLPDYEAVDYISIAAPGRYFSCEGLQGFLHTLDKDDTRCNAIQQDAGERCGCPSHPSGSTNNNETSSDEESEASEQEAPSTRPSQGSCSMCWDGQPVPLPDKSFEDSDFSIASCAEVDLFASLLPPGSAECQVTQLLGVYCGCPRAPGACTLCPNGESVPNKDKVLSGFEEALGSFPESYASLRSFLDSDCTLGCDIISTFLGDTPTCEIMESIASGPVGDLVGVDSDLLCWSTQLTSSVCGCSPSTYAIVLNWAYRISGSLSFLCSALIIAHILCKQEKKRFTVYHQLMLGISFFDLISSTAFILAAIMNPVESGVYQAMGNDATCKAQGVLVQLGLTSMLYNMCLAMYFFLVINYNWKERRFKKLQVWVHLVVVLIGTTQAFISLPWVGPYARLTGICAQQKPPRVSSDVPLTFLLTVPISVVLVVMTVTTAAICVHVYLGEVKANKWRADKRMVMTKTVFWRSFWYVMAFNVTQPMLLVQHYRQFSSRTEGEAILIVSAILAPSQGILNAIIYTHRSRSGRKQTDSDSFSWWRKSWCWKGQEASSTEKGQESSGEAYDTSDSVPAGVAMTADLKESAGGEDGDVLELNNDIEEKHVRPSNDGEGDEKYDHSAQQQDVGLTFDAVAEYWRLNELNDDSSGIVESDGEDSPDVESDGDDPPGLPRMDQ